MEHGKTLTDEKLDFLIYVLWSSVFVTLVAKKDPDSYVLTHVS